MNVERGEFLEWLSMLTVGLGILTLAMAPLAIPILALTAVAPLPLALPLVALALVAAVPYGLFRLIRGAGRRIGGDLHRHKRPLGGTSSRCAHHGPARDLVAIMRVFVAGATGVVGRQLVPQLVHSGHEVIGMTSKPEKSELVAELGATPVVADALDAESVGVAVSEASPDAIVHQMTDLARGINPRRQAEALAPTNRLRTAGAGDLLSAGMAVGIRRFVAQSFLVGLFEQYRLGREDGGDQGGS